MLRKLILVLPALLCSGTASAELTTFSFTGTITGGKDPVGSAITGSITLDPTAVGYLSETDGSTYNFQRALSLGADTNPLHISGNVCSITTCVDMLSFTNGFLEQDVTLQKNALGINSYQLALINFHAGDDFPIIDLSTTDSNGASSNMFSTPGLGLGQPINWFANGASTVGSFSNNDGYPDYFRDSYQITSVRVSVPEPGTFGLLAGSLLAMALVMSTKRARARC